MSEQNLNPTSFNANVQILILYGNKHIAIFYFITAAVAVVVFINKTIIIIYFFFLIFHIN